MLIISDYPEHRYSSTVRDADTYYSGMSDPQEDFWEPDFSPATICSPGSEFENKSLNRHDTYARSLSAHGSHTFSAPRTFSLQSTVLPEEHDDALYTAAPADLFTPEADEVHAKSLFHHQSVFESQRFSTISKRTESVKSLFEEPMYDMYGSYEPTTPETFCHSLQDNNIMLRQSIVPTLRVKRAPSTNANLLSTMQGLSLNNDLGHRTSTFCEAGVQRKPQQSLWPDSVGTSHGMASQRKIFTRSPRTSINPAFRSRLPQKAHLRETTTSPFVRKWVESTTCQPLPRRKRRSSLKSNSYRIAELECDYFD